MKNRKVYSGENLYRYIDGGAGLFLEFGFRELRLIRLARGKTELSVEMYRMTTPLSALGIYLARCAPETPIAGVIPRNSGDSYQLALVRGYWFILINNSDGGRNAFPLMRKLANSLAEQIPKTPPVWPCTLPRKGRVKGSIRLAKGPLALRSAWGPGGKGVLHLNGKNRAVFADYQINGKLETLIRVVYENAEKCRRVFNSLRENSCDCLGIIQGNNTSLIFRDNTGKTGIAKQHGQTLDIRIHLSPK